MKLFAKNAFLLIVFVLSAFKTISQNDAHYWTNQYGAKGLLLNGAVLASTEDETAVFYNPGAMGNGEDFGLSLSFFTPTYSVLTTKDYLGARSEVKDKGFGFGPGFGAVGFKPFKSPKLRAAITSFTRFRSNVRLRAREVGIVENQSDLLFLGDLEFQRSMSERWFGFGMAYRFSDHFSLGVSQFLTFHSESTDLSVRKEIVHRDNPFDLMLGWRSNFRYGFSTRGGMLTKFGISAGQEDVKIGLVVTTPTYYNYESSASYDADDQKIYETGDVELVSNLVSAELKNYKTPWSVGMGVDLQAEKSRFSISVEYFQKIPLYTVINDTDDPFNGLANGGNDQTTLVRTENRTIINLAFGYQRKYSEKSTLILGFRTDRNQRLVDQELETLSFLSTSPSIFHLSCGGFFTFSNNQFSAGLDYAFGRKKTNGRLVDFGHITPENLFGFSEDGSISSRYQSIVFIFTYDFILKSWKNRRALNKFFRKKWEKNRGLNHFWKLLIVTQ